MGTHHPSSHASGTQLNSRHTALLKSKQSAKQLGLLIQHTYAPHGKRILVHAAALKKKKKKK
ncbi:hypothetical protein, partial [Escherichia coli]|uniref:hypothetical protein n=1 Tax=Escherichia coli TaxID=562 RepID=UPI001BB003BB